MRHYLAACLIAIVCTIGGILYVVPSANAQRPPYRTMVNLAQKNWHCGHGLWGCFAGTGDFTGTPSGYSGWHMWGTYPEILIVPPWSTHNCWEDQWYTYTYLDRWTRHCS